MLHIKKTKVILINMLSEFIAESEEVEVMGQEQIKQTIWWIGKEINLRKKDNYKFIQVHER